MLHSRPSKSKKSSLWITKSICKEMDRCDRIFRHYRRNPSTGAWDIFNAQRNCVVQLQRKTKMEYFHQELCKKSHLEHIWNTLKLATASSALPENWSSLITQTTHHPLPTLSTPTSPLSAPLPSTRIILHLLLHLFLIQHPPSLWTQQLLNGARMLLLLSNQTALLGRLTTFCCPYCWPCCHLLSTVF